MVSPSKETVSHLLGLGRDGLAFRSPCCSLSGYRTLESVFTFPMIWNVCFMETGKEEEEGKVERGREEREKKKSKKGKDSFSVIKSMNVESTAFSWSILEVLTKTDLKQNENKGRKTNVL